MYYFGICADLIMSEIFKMILSTTCSVYIVHTKTACELVSQFMKCFVQYGGVFWYLCTSHNVRLPYSLQTIKFNHKKGKTEFISNGTV